MQFNVRRGRRDWGAILADLEGAGVPLRAVARVVSRNPGAVKHWVREGEQKESDARIVLARSAKHCPALYARHAAEFAIEVEGAPVVSETAE